MYTHEQIWTAIEEVARQRHWTNSKLAIQAGLNSTALNRSKRTNPKGKPHWPSSETIAKLLGAADISLREFVSFIEGSSGSVGAQAGNGRWLAPSDESDRPAAPLVADDLIVTGRLAAR
jgi:DNA-binding phage protein